MIVWLGMVAINACFDTVVIETFGWHGMVAKISNGIVARNAWQDPVGIETVGWLDLSKSSVS